MQRSALVQALLSVILWSTSAYFSLKLAHVPPFLLLGLTLSIGGLCSLHQMRQWRVSLKTLLLGVYGLFGSYFFYFLAFRYAPPVEANLINYLWPLLIVVLSPVFLPNYSLTEKHLIAALLGFIGSGLIVSGGHLTLNSHYLLGYIFAATGALIWASYSLMVKRVPPFPTSAIGLFCIVSGGLSLLMHLFFEQNYHFEAGDISLILIFGLGPMGIVFFLWDSAMKKGDPRVIGSLSYLIPMLSTIILVFTGIGRLVFTSGIAMLLIVISAVLGASSIKKRTV